MSVDKIIVMGVSGCGKSLVGTRLAEHLGVPFLDGDDFHSEQSVAKMAGGVPLDDTDRASWLARLAEVIAERPGLVLACSALKRRYREQLRAADPRVVFVYLQGDFATILERLEQREDHYFQGRAMLVSQFQQLEEPGPEEAVVVPIDGPADGVLARCLAGLAARD